MKAFSALFGAVLLNSATGQECAGSGCALVCVPNPIPGTAPCDACDGTTGVDCAVLIASDTELNNDCATCINDGGTACDGRMLTETYHLLCSVYCDFDATNLCELHEDITAANCASDCSPSMSVTDCENTCDNRGCTWTGDPTCECTCDCEASEEDECRVGGGCDEDCDDTPDGDGCMCVPDCAGTSQCNSPACESFEDCVLNDDKTECGCVLACDDKDRCDNPTCDEHEICEESGVVCACRLECDVSLNDEACGGGCSAGEECLENLDADGCMCVPDCSDTTQCNSQSCDPLTEECVLNDDKTDCVCVVVGPPTCDDKDHCNPTCDEHEICEESGGVCECRLECDVGLNDEACGITGCSAGEECHENLDADGCTCVPDCSDTTQCDSQSCASDEECVLNDDNTDCVCVVVGPPTCDDKDHCSPTCGVHEICAESGGVCECRLECDVGLNDEACGIIGCSAGEECHENLDADGCMCVPDCNDTTQCDNQACIDGEECELTDDKTSCECRDNRTTEEASSSDESTTSGGSVLHGSVTVAIVAALYSFSD